MQKNIDDKLQAEIEDVLQSRLFKNAGVNFKINDGQISLWGIVDVLSEKNAMEKAMRQIPGIKHVENNLTVAMDRQVSDEDIVSMVTEKMSENHIINLQHVGAEVADGVVTIVGNADSVAEVNAAIEEAEKVYGVKRVVSQAHVKTDNIDDASLTNMVITELSRSDDINVTDIDIETMGGIVYLRGKVDTIDQIESALRIIFRINGVKDVQSELIARHGESSGDTKLTNEIRDLLGQNGLSSVQAYVVNGILFLDGHVNTVDQKHKADELAERLDGVTGINNAITIAH